MIPGLHPRFVGEFVATHGPFKKVLDVGNLNVNADGGSIRTIFSEDTYTGVDMRGGDPKDLVLNGHDLFEYFKKPTFDLVISVDAFEHDDQFWVTWENMKQVLLPGGWALISVPSRGAYLHEYPGDYYRFMEESLTGYFFKDFEEVYVKTHWMSPAKDMEAEILGYGRKPHGLD